MKHYTSIKKLVLEGRGLVCVVDIPLGNDLPVSGEIITIDGANCECINTEYRVGFKRDASVGIIYKEIK